MLTVFYGTHIGPKNNQEDCLLVNGRIILDEDGADPVLETINGNEGLFVVCDGVGGNECGEWASRFVCEHLARRLSPAAAGPGEAHHRPEKPAQRRGATVVPTAAARPGPVRR